MSLLSHLHPRLKLVDPHPPDSEECIQDVVDFSPIPVPQDFIEVMREASDEQFSVEIPGEDPSYFSIWGADSCLEMNENYHVQEDLGEALAIGDNGGSEMLILIPGATPPGLYRIHMSNLDIDEASYICPSLTDLLAHADNISNVWA